MLRALQLLVGFYDGLNQLLMGSLVVMGQTAILWIIPERAVGEPDCGEPTFPFGELNIDLSRPC